MILLVIFVAKGWNINDYDFSSKVAVGGMLAILYMLYVAMIVEGNLHLDMPTSTYLYDTPPGIVLNCLRVLFAFILVGVFALGAVRAGNNADRGAQSVLQSLMLFIFAIAIWLLITPFTSLIVSFIDPYIRQKVAVCMENIGHFYGAGMLLWILWPGRIHEYFAVHDTILSQTLDIRSDYDPHGGSRYTAAHVDQNESAL